MYVICFTNTEWRKNEIKNIDYRGSNIISGNFPNAGPACSTRWFWRTWQRW